MIECLIAKQTNKKANKTETTAFAVNVPAFEAGEKNCHKIRQGIICKLCIKHYPHRRHLDQGSKASEEIG